MTRRQPGFALLITLWLLLPLSILFLTLAGAARLDGQVAGNVRDAAVLQAAADGGIETTILSLLRARAVPPADGGATVAVAVEPLSGFVNPNLATVEVLQALLVGVGVQQAQAEALSAAIVEWRTPGQRGQDGRAKAERYRAAGLQYGPPGAPFESIGELRDVIGMTPALVAALQPYLSLFADRPPDPALAPPLLRAALNTLNPPPRPGDEPGSVFRITATAANAARAVVVRSAVIRFVAGNGRAWRVLAWGE